MNRKQKKEQKRLLSTRQLMGIDQFTEHGLKVGRSELVYFLVQPDNLSVLSAEGIRGRVMVLTNLLRQDAVHLDSIQATAASAREFARIFELDRQGEESVRSRFERGSTSDMKQSVTAEANLQDVAALVTTMHRSREPLVHCAVYLDLAARDLESLRDEVTGELIRSKLAADRLLLKQREGFLSANPAGRNAFGAQFERVLPASSTANLFPFNYSGKTDPEGVYIGKDKYGSNIIVDLDRRAEDKTNASMLILGNSGQGRAICSSSWCAISWSPGSP